ncbi:MAG: GreA/GreB family elongation factor, partial [Pseudomonadota bacterium]|nr:GreA/GreB family elongation factor [Pseudomonadota bacterium]
EQRIALSIYPIVRDSTDNADQVRSQDIAADIVTMHTQLRVSDTADGQERCITLCYPSEADAARGMISVLSPLGTALLGLRVGDLARWHGADGQTVEWHIRAIDYQPEARGDYTV